MFQSARIKLTIWYTLIIMLVSLSFSLVVHRVLTLELDRVERIQRLRIEGRSGERNRLFINGERLETPVRPFFLDPELVKETKGRLDIILVLVNLAILMISAAAGYFLAGRTLKPIKEMVDDQSRFITDVSHELRTPLTALKTEIEVSLRAKNLSSDEARNTLKSNLEEVNNLQTLSDGLIKLTQYQKGTNGLNFTEIFLRQLFDEASKKIGSQSARKKIKISRTGDDFKFEANWQTLLELLVILLDNAVKYSPAESEINLSGRRVDGQVILSVSDQGSGIEEKDLPHIFDRFYRADHSRTKGTVSGYGLGLSIAKQIAQRHGGSMKVKSKIGSGSVFTVSLPEKHNAKLI